MTSAERERRGADAAVGLFVVRTIGRIGDPFAVGHEGFNAAVWSTGARAISERGWLASQFGGHALGQDYANHPPLTYLVAWAARAVLGHDERAVRIVMLGASSIGIVLLYVLVRQWGLRPAAAAAGVIVAGATPMFLYYGTMLDSWILGMPLVVGLLVAMSTERRRPRTVAVLAALVALCCWQGVIVMGCAFVAARRSPRLRRDVWWMVAGAAVGTVVTWAWIAWVYAGIGPAIDQFRSRSADPVGISSWLNRQLTFGVDTFRYALVLLPVALWCALRRREGRELALVLVVAAAIYPLVFRQGAYIHDYWNYFVLLPLAYGSAIAADWLLARRREIVGLAAVVLAAYGVHGAVHHSFIEWAWRPSPFEALAASVDAPADQDVVPIVLAPGDDPSPQLRYYLDRDIERVDAVPPGMVAVVALDTGVERWTVARP